MNFLVTGGGGFIGSHLVEYLLSNGHGVTVIDNLNTGKKENLKSVINKIEFVNGDVRDVELLRKLYKNKNGVFHEAALASVQESFTKQAEYHDVNVNGMENILKLAKEFDIKVVYASSSSVYGNPVRTPIKEGDPKNPINPYAQTKLDDEKLAARYAQDGVQVIGLRYFNVFGERQSDEYAGVIKKFLSAIRDKKPPMINGDGLQSRDFVHVGDVVRANVLAMKSNVRHGFFNIGTNSTITVLELANLIVEASGLDLKPVHAPALQGDVRITEADISLARDLLGWQPEIDIKNWLKTIISTKKLDLVVD